MPSATGRKPGFGINFSTLIAKGDVVPIIGEELLQIPENRREPLSTRRWRNVTPSCGDRAGRTVPGKS